MKRWVKIALWSIFAIIIFAGLIITQKAQREMVLETADIRVHADGENTFLTVEEVRELLRVEGLVFEGQTREQLDIEKIEAYLGAISQVKKVKVYSYIGGQWRIDLETRKPIARIFNKHGESFYLDDDGNVVKTSVDHAAHVLVVTGKISDRLNSISVKEIESDDSLKRVRKLDDVYRIATFVSEDPLFKSLIGQVHLEKNGDFVMIPLVGDQKIVFGTAHSRKEVSEKFEKLRIFYKEAMPYEGWDKYTEINLKYDDQIVGKQRKNGQG